MEDLNKRVALFPNLEEGLEVFIGASLFAKLKEGKPENPLWKDKELYEESVEYLAKTLKKNPVSKSSDKLWVIHHFAVIIKAFIDNGHFFEWCKVNQKIIIDIPWEDLRRELALIMNLMMEMEAACEH